MPNTSSIFKILSISVLDGQQALLQKVNTDKKMKNSSKHKKRGPSLISKKFVVRNFPGKKLKRSRNGHQQTLFKVQDKVLRNN